MRNGTEALPPLMVVGSPSGILLTAKEVAARLALSHRSLENWRLRGGGPPYVKLGKLIRYRTADVETWVAANVRGMPSPRHRGSDPRAT
jgi:excisionase family DNA binding protein